MVTSETEPLSGGRRVEVGLSRTAPSTSSTGQPMVTTPERSGPDAQLSIQTVGVSFCQYRTVEGELDALPVFAAHLHLSPTPLSDDEVRYEVNYLTHLTPSHSDRRRLDFYFLLVIQLTWQKTTVATAPASLHFAPLIILSASSLAHHSTSAYSAVLIPPPPPCEGPPSQAT